MIVELLSVAYDILSMITRTQRFPLEEGDGSAPPDHPRPTSCQCTLEGAMPVAINIVLILKSDGNPHICVSGVSRKSLDVTRWGV